MKFFQGLYLLLLFSIFTSSSFAASISGTVTNTESISLYYISNFITGEKVYIAASDVNEKGQFSLEFEATELRTYYINLGSRIAQIVIAPKQVLSFNLPDYLPLRKSEYLNPYFEHEMVLVYDKNTKDINYYQMQIELMSARQLQRVLESSSPGHTALSAIDSLKNLSSQFDERYLTEYAKYSEALFYQMSQPENINAIKQEYLRKSSPSLQNTAFINLFLSEYHNPFLAPDGLFYHVVSNAIIEGQLPKSFCTSIATDQRITNPTMAELVTIKGFYDAALYVPSYQRVITELMRQLEGQLQDSTMVELCKSSRIEIERLMIGNPAPYYELYTLKGKKVPTVLKRRNVLLAFVNTNIVECHKQLRLLEKYKQMYKRQIEVVVVAVYQDPKELERFLNRNEYQDIFFTLWDNNEQILEDYNVKALPSYYLIGNDGNIIYAPLSSPEEDMLIELQSVITN